ncbi:MAG: DUF362 domain-containing protein [Rikenellaceae bacterium]|nr:DUF362 domain-containing protein [Rikenellaceae bacterium]
MKRILFVLAVAMMAASCAPKELAMPKVYMTTDISPEGLVKVYEALGVDYDGKVAVKISTGERGGHNFLKADLIAPLVQKVEGTIVECNVAYPGARYTTEEHWNTIKLHGFYDIAPCDIMDEFGEMRIPVQDTTHLKFNIVGDHVANYDWMINLAHFKGHAMGGFGGVLKNQSIGVASSNGKAYIHSAGKVTTKEELWAGIGQTEQDHFLEAMAAAAQSIHEYYGGKMVYINVMNNLSVDCDCNAHPADPEMNDIGILASTDPVALDQACVDLVFEYPSTEGDDAAALIERINSRHGIHIIEHAEKIGLGSRTYELVKID